MYTRQWSGGSSSTGSSSPAMSPAHPQSRLGQPSGYSTIKRTQNVAAKAAAQRLAQVMASQTVDDDDEDDDDLGFRFAAPTSFGNNSANNNGSGSALSGVSFGKPNRSPSPAVSQNNSFRSALVYLNCVSYSICLSLSFKTVSLLV